MDAQEFKAMYSRAVSFENVALKQGEATPRDRFNNIMNFRKFDRIIDTEFGYWDNTLRRWHSEGLPSYVDSNDKADIFFGFDVWRKAIPVITQLFPEFDEEIIEDDGVNKIIFDSSHVKCQVFSDGTDTIPHYIDFPVKDRESYKMLKERLQEKPIERIKVKMAEIAGMLKNRNYILEVYAGSTAGIIRNWMGFENICFAIYDQPELLDEILDDLSKIGTSVAREITKYTQVDLVSWWEDIAFKTGPIVTPGFFIDKCGKAVKKVMDIYRENGTQWSFVDCDGDFRLLMPGWFDNGVNIMFPLEVASGIHPEKLRKENPSIRMMGGVDKTVLSGTKYDIRKELLKLKPLVEEGGYIPHVNHRVQADVSYQNYLYYLEEKRNIFGIPNQAAKA